MIKLDKNTKRKVIMKKSKKNKGFFDKKRFEWMEGEKKKWLQNLTLDESIKITEEFLSSNMFEQLRNNFSYDEPTSLKLSLKERKNNVRASIQKNSYFLK